MEFISRRVTAPHTHGHQTNQTEKKVKEAERKMGKMSMTHTGSKIHQKLGLNDKSK